jgi:hypothetical protein
MEEGSVEDDEAVGLRCNKPTVAGKPSIMRALLCDESRTADALREVADRGDDRMAQPGFTFVVRVKMELMA